MRTCERQQKELNTLPRCPDFRRGNARIYGTVKRFLDILVSLAGILILVLLIPIVKLCYLADGDRQPIFYIQNRVGLKGSVFRMYKFRSMVCDADEILKRLKQEPVYAKQWQEKQKLEDDPRITRIGRILRRTSVDEIPQFLNVLRGEMSVVGPRPLVEGELEAHQGLKKYNQVKPGITGWWVCSRRSGKTYEERLSLEYDYIDHCCLRLDLLCFLRTIAVVFTGEGAQ